MSLFAAARQGDIASIQAALDDGADPNAAGEFNETLLIAAAESGSIALAEALLAAGAAIDRCNDFGFDALGSALWCSHLSLADFLVERGAPVSISSAAALGDIERLDREWGRAPPLEDSIGTYLGACRTGQVGVLRWFIEREMPVDLHPPGEEWGGIGCPGLHHTAVNGHTDAVSFLLSCGADLKLVDDADGSHALAWAASAGQVAVIDVLVAAGADVTHQNRHGLGAADLAERNGFSPLGAKLRKLASGYPHKKETD